ncbi:peptide chain release factor 1 [endosymbiont of Acanthamoeba sp. UWC8]|uniref:peptide chain release factor 1 n=1 Tax=endosymbiont of Acanthamoeba sp. UWC8 TaxID=86106 RepID=UPI0004D11264|nr:peptide chain release factor 1 [endosymbiont of Acanthamoeba sp. UWC8]AIF80783.1 peptide chain release factor 1 [endosymbiont of Acanthamoeba sp. UWC8]
MSFSEKLDKIIGRFDELNQRFLNPDAIPSAEFSKIAKERSDLEQIVPLAQKYRKTEDAKQELEQMLKDPNLDPDFKEVVQQEIKDSTKQLEDLTQELKVALIPKDEYDEKNAIIEIRAGTGGDEAALFAAVLFRMYQRYAEKNRWKVEILSASETGLDGYKEISVSITGRGVFARLKFESGVHRVQRVPETESSGRIHTSAATVAVLPEAEEVDIHIEEKDLKIDVFRASGAGGQHVNTTDSAVRITHIPTGVVVTQQDEKSQHKNKARALKILRSRLFEAQRERIEAERSALRKGQVGSGDRSERIRTYNYPQSRVTDHRINITLYDLNKVTNEGFIDPFIDALNAEDQAEKLSASED